MKRKLYLMSVVVITLITISVIMNLHPNYGDTLAGEKYKQLSSFLTDVISNDVNKDEKNHIIDDEVLGKFIKFYSNISIDKLEIYEKEEIRYILECMGNNNTKKLKELLENESKKKEEEIHKLLSENLFDKQLLLLEEMLK